MKTRHPHRNAPSCRFANGDDWRILPPTHGICSHAPFRAVEPERRIRAVIHPEGRKHWKVLGDRDFPYSRITQFETLAKRAGTGLAASSVSSHLALDDIWFYALQQRYPPTMSELGFANLNCIMHAAEKSAEMCSAYEGEALEDERAEELKARVPAVPTPSTTELRISAMAFPRRAAWLAERLGDRGWDHNTLESHNGPDHKTTLKILHGDKVISKVLRRVVTGLNSHLSAPKVKYPDIPKD